MMTIDSAQVLAEIGALQHRISSPSAFLQEVGTVQQEKAQARIRDTKDTPWGAAWAPWQPMTLKERTIKGNADQGLLWDSGALLNSIHYELEPFSVTIGTDLEYALDLQDGTDRMAARPFLGWDDLDLGDIEKLAAMYFYSEFGL